MLKDFNYREPPEQALQFVPRPQDISEFGFVDSPHKFEHDTEGIEE